MKSYRLEGLARNCPRDKFYAWYTDFASEDPEIIERHKKPTSGKMLSRKLISREGNKLRVETVYQFFGRKMRGDMDIVLSPRDFTYKAVVVVARMFEDHRSYRFLETVEGTKVVMEGSYRAKSPGMKLFDALGLLKSMYVKDSKGVTDALCRAAEIELAGPAPCA